MLTFEENFFHVWDYLALCVSKGIVVNEKKFKFCKDTVEFAGLMITPTGVAPSDKILSAIEKILELHLGILGRYRIT